MKGTADPSDPLPLGQRNQLFRNLSDGTFVEISSSAQAAFTRSEISRGLAVGDLDNDGDPDLVVSNNNGPVRLLLNKVGQNKSWLGVRLVEGDAQRDALGARAELLREDQSSLWRRAFVDGSYASSNDPRIIFGLADDRSTQTVRVYWPDGSIEEWSDLKVGEYRVLASGSGSSVEQ